MGYVPIGNKDFLAGLIFLAFGLAAIHIADRDLPMGTMMRMGPGNFPALLGGILGLLASTWRRAASAGRRRRRGAWCGNGGR